MRYDHDSAIFTLIREGAITNREADEYYRSTMRTHRPPQPLPIPVPSIGKNLEL